MANLWAEHGPWLVPLLWMLLSAIINAAMHYRSAEDWASWAAANPRLASLVRLCSALGVDPAKAIKALAVTVSRRASRG